MSKSVSKAIQRLQRAAPGAVIITPDTSKLPEAGRWSRR
jgi:hypothetical protein